jgi:outer membrane protein assembly factor BamB
MSRPPRPLAAVALVALLVASSLLVAGSAATAAARPGSAAPTARPAASPAGPSPSGAWPTYMYDVERTGANHLETLLGPATVGGLRPIWSVPSAGSDFSAPIVVGDVAYVGSWDGDEVAVNVTDGSTLWTSFLGTDPSCNGGYSPMGISSTAAYLDGTLYLGGGDGYWYALNASTGATDWRVLVGSEAAGYFDWSSALVHAGSLYVGTASCFDDPLVPAGLLKINLTSHAVVAQFNATPANGTGESIWTTPALDPTNDTVWVATGNENPPGYPLYANAIVGLNATTLNVSGSWQVPNVAGEDSDFGSTPTLFRTSTGVPMIVASNKNGVAYALDRANVSADGSWGPVWNLTTGGGFSGAAFDGQQLYLAGGGTIYAVDPANGTVLWTAPMLGGGYVYGSLAWANGVVYAGGGGTVEAIDAANGSVLWNASLGGAQQTVTEPVVVNGQLYVASGDYGSQGFLTAFGLRAVAAYGVTFHETGLPAGKAWSASLGGTSVSASAPTITIDEPNGSFPYLVRGSHGYGVEGSSPAGTITVGGANSSVTVAFAREATAAVTFAEGGLPRHQSWCVGFSGWYGCTSHDRLSLGDLAPFSYAYAIGALPGYAVVASVHHLTVPRAGTLNVSGGTTVKVRYVPVTYQLTFAETGLAPGVRWTVKLRGLLHGRTTTVHRSSRNGTVVFLVPNGTFTYTVESVRSYSGGGAGSVAVDAGPASVAISFTAASPRAADRAT